MCVLLLAGAVAEAVHRAELKVRLVHSRTWARWLPCAAGINTRWCQLEAYRPWHRRLLLPLLSPAPKSAVTSYAGWETCLETFVRLSQLIPVLRQASVSSPSCGGRCRTVVTLPASARVALPARLVTGGAAAGTGSLLLPRCQPSQSLSRCCQGSKEAKSQHRDAACRALSARCRSPPSAGTALGSAGFHSCFSDTHSRQKATLENVTVLRWPSLCCSSHCTETAELCSLGVGVLLGARCPAGGGQGGLPSTDTSLAPGARH